MSVRWLDQPGPVRTGQEIEPERLADYLRTHVEGFGAGSVSIEQFPSGYSNLTYLVRSAGRAVVVRRPPVGVHIATAHDVGREHRILSSLSAVYPRVPRPLAFCGDADLIGTPFYVMERVEGVILRKEMPPAMRPTPDVARAVATSLVETLAELHAVDYGAAGLGDLGRPAGYVGRQVEGWTKRYRAAETERVPDADRLAAWLRDDMPPDRGAALIHNDFKHDNVVLDPADWSRVVAVLDWEMATLGDPLMDLGATLAYWTEPTDPAGMLEARLSPTLLPGTPGRAEVVELYARASGRPVDDVVYYYAFGLFKVAVIVQQLYARWLSGQSTDERFAGLVEGVRALAETGVRAIERGRIDDLG